MNTLPHPTHPDTLAFLCGPLGKTNLRPPLAGFPLKVCPSALTLRQCLPPFQDPSRFSARRRPGSSDHALGCMGIWRRIRLCTTTPNACPDEPARGKVFQQCLGRAFSNLTFTSSMGRDAHPNGTLFYHGSYVSHLHRVQKRERS